MSDPILDPAQAVHVSCEDCGAACCREIILPASRDRPTNDWLRARGDGQRTPGGRWGRFVIQSVCPQLTEDDRCGIYADRPLICAEYKVGGPACLDARGRRR